jgi:hypothetical protein
LFISLHFQDRLRSVFAGDDHGVKLLHLFRLDYLNELRAKMDDDIEMSDGHPPEDDSQLPPSPHQLDRLQYHISLQEMGEKLQAAANAAFPNDRRM